VNAVRQDRGGEISQRASGVTASWAAVFRDVRTLAVDLTTAGSQLARQLPVPQFDQLGSGLTRLEDAVLREIKNRLDQVDAANATYHVHAAGGPKPTPAQLLDELLGASIDADTAGSRDELYRSLLLRLVPDEARILAELAGGAAFPLVHVQSRASGGRTVLSNASTVGRAAGVQVPDAVSTYVAHLRILGLAEEGPSDDSLSVQYDILLGEPGVRSAEEEARGAGRLGVRMVRRTLRISPLGRELWRACRPDDQLDSGSDGSDRYADADDQESDELTPALRSAVTSSSFQPDSARPHSGNGVNGSPGEHYN
jgi:hypothetical protein